MSLKPYLTEIELPIWQDPQGDVIVEKSRDYCFLYFWCWDENNSPDFADYIGRIEFVGAWALRSVDVEDYAIHPKEDYQFKSSIFIVKNSEWLSEVIKIREKQYSDNWSSWKEKPIHHYLVKGHDNYFEIIAESYQIEKIKLEHAGKYKRLIEG